MAFKKRRIFDLHHVQAQQMATTASHRRSHPIHNHSHNPIRPQHGFRQIGEWFTENMRNYCQTTSLHGFSYITRQDISRHERWFWLVVVILAIITSIVLVVVSWYWSQETPTVTVIESSHFPTWNIPFPAVTICNFNKISKTKALSMLDQMKVPVGVNRSELHNLFNLTLLPVDTMISNDSLQIYDRILRLNNLTLTRLTQQLSPDCIEMISSCIWKGINTRCDSLFQRIDTMEGQCCTFNYFGGISNNFPEKIAYQVPKRPYRVTGCGYPTGLSVLLNPMMSDYYGTFFSGYGFRLLLHDAYNFPDENSETKVVTTTRESFVRINPESTYATNDIRRMDLALRNCLFGSERTMHGLRRYSFINCMFECRVRMAVDLCGCLPPYVYNNGSYKVCGVLLTNCIIQSKRIFSHALANLNFSLSIVRETDSFPCGCLPDCQSNHYVSESTTGRLDMSYFANRPSFKYYALQPAPQSMYLILLFIYSMHRAYPNSNATDRILLHVFFSDLMSTRYRTDIFQNWLSALASFGGLLGLIMGFSIVTAFEFVYFLTFRPVFNYINRD